MAGASAGRDSAGRHRPGDLIGSGKYTVDSVLGTGSNAVTYKVDAAPLLRAFPVAPASGGCSWAPCDDASMRALHGNMGVWHVMAWQDTRYMWGCREHPKRCSLSH